MKTIVILGATGNVGSYFTKYACERFLGQGYHVVASGKRSKADALTNLGAEYIPVDITKPETLERLPKKNVYAVVLLAAVIPAYMEGYHPEAYLDSIIDGTFNVLEYCRKYGVEKILYSTSCFDIWEYPSGMLVKADAPKKFNYTGDHAMYVISKNAACELIEHYHQQYGIKTFVFRFPPIYSYTTNHYYYPDGVKTLRPLFKSIFNAIDGRPLEIWGDPNAVKNLVYVYDVAQMMCLAIENKSLDKGIYNCGTGVPVTLRQQMEAIAEVFCSKDRLSPIVVLDDKPSAETVILDVENAVIELGYKPIYDPVALFRDFQKEMQHDRFLELRGR